MIRAVVDTNVIVSGFGWTGTASQVIDAAFEGRFVIVTSEPLLAELDAVLRYDKLASRFPDPRRLVERMRESAIVADPDHRVRIFDDDPDNRLVEAVEAGPAHLIVTGDARVLSADPLGHIRIVNPEEFLRLLDALESDR